MKNIPPNENIQLKNEQLANSIDFIEIRMPKKIESPS